MRPQPDPRPMRRTRRPLRVPSGGPARGNTLLEALVFMAIISVTVASFTLGAVALMKAQRDQHGLDIASQAAHGQLEKAKSLAWDGLGFAKTDAGYRATFNGHKTVPLVEPAQEGRLTPTSETTIKGVLVKLRTDITWLTEPPASNPGFGTKLITVTATWQPTGNAEKTATFSQIRTSQADEAPPTPLPTDFGTPPPPMPTPTVDPQPTSTVGVGDEPGGW